MQQCSPGPGVDRSQGRRDVNYGFAAMVHAVSLWSMEIVEELPGEKAARKQSKIRKMPHVELQRIGKGKESRTTLFESSKMPYGTEKRPVENELDMLSINYLLQTL